MRLFPLPPPDDPDPVCFVCGHEIGDLEWFTDLADGRSLHLICKPPKLPRHRRKRRQLAFPFVQEGGANGAGL